MCRLHTHARDGRATAVYPLAAAAAQAVLVVAATNRPDLVDAALLRPGRFDRLVHVTLPDAAARAQILDIHTRRMPLAPDVALAALADRSDGYSGAELAAAQQAQPRRPGSDRLPPPHLRPEAPSRLRTAAPLGSRAELRPLGPRRAALAPLPGRRQRHWCRRPFPVQAVCREAALAALEESLQAQLVGGAHFEAALRTVRPRTDAATLRFYQDYEVSTHGGGTPKAGAPPAVAANNDRTPFAFGQVK